MRYSGLRNLTRRNSAPPTWTAPASTDARAAWDGTWPGSGHPLHVEAGAWHGKPVFFSLIGPWIRTERMRPSEETRKQKVSNMIGLAIAIAIVVSGVWFAVRNYQRGRGDRRGAFRLACVVFAVEMLICLCRAHLCQR